MDFTQEDHNIIATFMGDLHQAMADRGSSSLVSALPNPLTKHVCFAGIGQSYTLLSII
jgi:hypothetical protein